MTELLRDLRRAAALFAELAQARHLIAMAPGRAEHLAALAREHRDDSDAEAGAEADRRRDARRLEAELQDVEARWRDRQDRRREAADAAAVQALQGELAHLAQRRRDLEARVLEAWEAVESQAARRADARTAAEATTARLDQERADLADRQRQAAAAAGEVESELKDVLAGLPARVTAKLDRLAQRHENPIAGLMNGACEACGQSLPPQQALDADQDRALPVCTGCGRFVVARRGARPGEWV